MPGGFLLLRCLYETKKCCPASFLARLQETVGRGLGGYDAERASGPGIDRRHLVEFDTLIWSRVLYDA